MRAKTLNSYRVNRVQHSCNFFSQMFSKNSDVQENVWGKVWAAYQRPLVEQSSQQREGWTRQRGKWTQCGGSLTNKTFPASHRIPATEFLHEPLSPADTRHQSQAAANVTLLVDKTMFINRWCCQFSCNNHLSNVSVSCLTAATLRLSAWTKITSFKLLAAACRRDTWIISICSEPCSGYRGVSGAVTCNV